ncbi:MAG: hypothetical protein QOI55_1851 [Actinomycetota bacterium]|nr:hypothetical protein [Actinomycetota bacterium]
MKIRWRLALVLAVSLLLVGSAAIFITSVGYERAVFNSPFDLQAEILNELGVKRSIAVEYLRKHPEAALNYDTSKPITADGRSVNDIFADIQRRHQRASVRRSRAVSAAALGVLAVLTGLLGWIIAGQVLRPVRLITSRARSASDLDLGGRVALSGPDDEMKQLADTFDEMLGRIERSFVAQRRFSSQVSHELRTPLSVIRSESDLLLSAEATNGERQSVEVIRTAALRAERLIGALLVLSRTESGNVDHQTVLLDELVGDVLGRLVLGAPLNELRIDVELHPAHVVGDRALLESLVTNLVDNAAQYNVDGGWVRVRVLADTSHAVFEVSNSMGEPRSGGNGIGLTVVEAIAAAHGGELHHPDVIGAEIIVRVLLPRVNDDSDAHDRNNSHTTSTDPAAVS